LWGDGLVGLSWSLRDSKAYNTNYVGFFMTNAQSKQEVKKIVVIGGGTGTYTVLRGLKKYNVDLTAIVSMADDGGSTGRLRDEYGVLPPGDIRRGIVALSDSTELMKELFEHRFSDGLLRGHSFGNLFITALKDILKDDAKAISEACRLLNIKGKVLPVTLNDVKLCAELEDGQLIIGERNLDFPKHDPNLKINKVFLSPKATANSEAVKSISEADMIVLGPGDLYGSVVANFLVEGITDAIRKSKGKVVYVCNLMTKNGETNSFTVSDFVSVIEEHLGKEIVGNVVYNETSFNQSLLDKYLTEKKRPVLVDKEKFDNFKAEFIAGDLATEPILIRHDSEKLAEVLMRL
jgi:uncharacterized cofD-like protein